MILSALLRLLLSVLYASVAAGSFIMKLVFCFFKHICVMYICNMCVCVCVCVCVKLLQCCLSVTLWVVTRQVSLSMGFSRQERWSGLPCSLPGDFPEPGINHISYISFIGRRVCGLLPLSLFINVKPLLFSVTIPHPLGSGRIFMAVLKKTCICTFSRDC